MNTLDSQKGKMQAFLRELEVKREKLRNVQSIFCDNFLDSLANTGELECDIQVFIDENKTCQSLADLPDCPLTIFLRGYTTPINFAHPKITLPLSSRGGILTEISYDKLFLGLAVTFQMLPAFDRSSPPLSAVDVPSSVQKKEQLLHLAASLANAQEGFWGVVNGALLPGLDFLGRLATDYGVSLIYDENPDSFLVHPPSVKDVQLTAKAKRVAKYERFHRNVGPIIPFLRKYPTALEDFSAFALEFRWARVSQGGLEYGTIREGMLRMMRMSGVKDWFSLAERIC